MTGKKKKLTFFNIAGDIFLRDIVINLRKDYDVKFFYRGDEKEFHQLLHDSDIAWFEFCDQLPTVATQAPKLCKYVVRLHSFEMFTDFPAKVNWDRIDKLIFVNDVVHDYCIKKYNIPPQIAEVVYNGVNPDKYLIPDKKKFKKKVAFVGYMNYKKGPQLLLNVFDEIYKHDNKYSFHIAGDHQDERIQLYFATMQEQYPFKIYWDGFQRDIPAFLNNKDFIISTSLFESFQYGVAEGMLQGCIPLVHRWLGAEAFYPKSNIFTTPSQAVEIVKRFEETEDKDAERQKMRDHIATNFSINNQIEKIRNILESL